MTLTAIPSNQPEDLLINSKAFDEFINSPEPQFSTRLGTEKKTVSGQLDAIQDAADVVLSGIGYAVPVAYTAGISLTLRTQTVEYSGNVYAPVAGQLPFTTSGTFETAKFRLIQGVAFSDLAAPGGAALVGYDPADGDTTNVATTILRREAGAKLRYLCAKMAAGEAVNIAYYGDSTTDGNDTTGHTINPVDGSGNAIGNSDHEATAPNAWPAKTTALLRTMFGNANIGGWNAGYSGKRMDNGWALANYDAAITNNPYYGTPDACFIGFGLNDIGIAGSQIDDHTIQTRLLCRKLLDAGTLPILISSDAMWLVTPNIRDNKEVSRQIDEAKRAVADELGIPFFDIGMLEREWLERNIDGYRWAQTQADGLHFGDDGHAFKATAAAARLFRDIFEFDGTPQQLQLMDSRTARTITASNNSETTNMRQGASFFETVSGGEVLATAWVWNRDPGAELIYRGLNGESFDSNTFTTPPKIKITEYIGGAVVAEKTPAGAGLQGAVFSLSELPYRIAALPYGLVKVEYIAGADPTPTHWIGAFELWSTVRGSRDYSACLSSYSSVGGPVAGVDFVPENPDGTNVFGLTAGEFVDIFVDATLAKRAGVVLAHANSWGGSPSRAYGSKGFLYVLRGITDVVYVGTSAIQPSGVVVSSSLGVVAGLNLSGRTKFRVRIYRDGASRVIKVYPGWNVSATPDTFTLSSADACIPLAGAIGGIYFEPESPGIYRQSVIHSIFKRQALLADDVSAGVGAPVDFPALLKIAGSAVAASVVGASDGTAEKTLATVTLPRLGPNAEVGMRLAFSAPVGSGAAKAYRARVNGVQIWSGSNSSSAAYAASPVMTNRGASNSQFTTNGQAGASTSTHTTTTLDTSVETTLTITAQLANSADTATLEAFSITLTQA